DNGGVVDRLRVGRRLERLEGNLNRLDLARVERADVVPGQRAGRHAATDRWRRRDKLELTCVIGVGQRRWAGNCVVPTSNLVGSNAKRSGVQIQLPIWGAACGVTLDLHLAEIAGEIVPAPGAQASDVCIESIHRASAAAGKGCGIAIVGQVATKLKV